MDYSIFGCKVNKYYLNKRLDYFKERDFVDQDGHLLASCVVTDRAKSKRLKEAQQLLEDGKHVYLTGCGSFEQGEAIDYETFFSLYPQLRTYADRLTLLGEDPDRQTDLGRIGEYELNREVTETTRPATNIYTRKFVLIQSGCDTYCTFCLTVHKRGNHTSRSAEEIVEEINQFVDQGGKEVILTGVNLAAWGCTHTRKPHESKFSDLLAVILRRTTVPRIRISSLGPEFLDNQFFELMHNERFLPHFHVSIQHFSDHILRAMNRNYTRDRLISVLHKLRGLQRSDQEYISIGGDLIVGFPGETEETFQQLLDAVEEFSITKLHAFPFSGHQKGTPVPAGSFANQVPTELKKERMQRLLAIGKQVRNKFIEKNKSVTWPILLERNNGNRRKGWTPNYLRRTVTGAYESGMIVQG